MSERLYLNPKEVHSLKTWNSIAGTAVLSDGRKVREFHDSTEPDPKKATWYEVTKPKKRKHRLPSSKDIEMLPIYD